MSQPEESVQDMHVNDKPRWSDTVNAIYEAPIMTKLEIPSAVIQIIVDDCFEWHWDKSMSFGIDLSEQDCKLASYTHDPDVIIRVVSSPQNWQTTRGNMCLDNKNGYIYEWDIDATDYHKDFGDLIIGILADDGVRPDPENILQHKNEGFIDKCEIWAYHSTNLSNCGGYTTHGYTSRKIGGSVDHDIELSEEFHQGDKITVIYDSKFGTLQFKKNDKYVVKKNPAQDEDSRIIYQGIEGDIFPFVTIYSRHANAKLLDIRYYSHK